MEKKAEALNTAKRAAGYRAAEMVEDGMVVGLGTGSTVYFTIERLSERIRDGLTDHRYPDIVPDRTPGKGGGNPAHHAR